MSAIEQAMQMYADIGKPEDFWERFSEYALAGYVVCLPNAFLMAKLTDGEEGPEWFVECFVGKLPHAFELLRFSTQRLTYFRWKNGQLNRRSVSMNRFVRLANANAKS